MRGLFDALFANYLRLIRWQFGLNFFQYTHTLLMMLLPSVIIAPRVLSGELEVGRIVEATGAFSAIMGSLTILLDNMEDLSRYAAGIRRVKTLHAALNRAASGSGREKIEMVESDRLHFDNVTLQTPNYERTLIRELTASIPCGKSLMIVGGSGLGKSSLLRMMAGLWRCGEGTLERPDPDDLLFLPQHAYMIVGSLREQLMYPNLDHEPSDEELRDILERVNLPDLEERLWRLRQISWTSRKSCPSENASGWPSRESCSRTPATSCSTKPPAPSTAKMRKPYTRSSSPPTRRSSA